MKHVSPLLTTAIFEQLEINAGVVGATVDGAAVWIIGLKQITWPTLSALQSMFGL